MMNIYVGKNIVKVNETNLLGMDINVLKSIPYSVACKYADYISAIEICVEDCLDIPIDIKDEEGYLVALTELETIMENDKEESDMVENNVNNVAVEETVETINNENKEEMVNMMNVRGNMEVAVADMMDKFQEAKENIKVNVGETKEEYFNKIDDSLNVMKGAFGNIIDTLDNLLGYSTLKDSIIAIIEAGTDGKSSKKDLFKMARKCRELIEEEIEFINEFGNEEDFNKAVQLKALTEGIRGKSVFEAFASGCVWIGKRVTRKLHKWFHIDNEESVMGSICKSISGFVNILRTGAKIVWSTAKFAVSFLVAGAIKIADFVFSTIITLVSKIKAFAVEKYEKFTRKDEEEDNLEDFDYEE